VTARGAKHLEELGDMAEAGRRAVMVYLVQRTDCANLSLAADLDPTYAAAFARAAKRGVEALAIGCSITPQEIVADRPVNLAIA
jgi:sugar fermentation stimulation protein A